MGTPFKMKGYDYPGKSPVEQKDIDLSKMSDEEVADVAKRNIDVIKKQGDDSMYIDENSTQEEKMDVYKYYRDLDSVPNDSIDAARDELMLRLNNEKSDD